MDPCFSIHGCWVLYGDEMIAYHDVHCFAGGMSRDVYMKEGRIWRWPHDLVSFSLALWAMAFARICIHRN